MERYEIKIHRRVYNTIYETQEYIASLNTYEAAEKYASRLFAEIESLSNPLIANAMQPSQWQVAKKYHRNAKRLITKNRKWNIIFRTGRKIVYIYDIIPSSMMK